MFDTERFICEIELRPTIWDVSSKSYSNKCEKSKAWEEHMNFLLMDSKIWRRMTKIKRVCNFSPLLISTQKLFSDLSCVISGVDSGPCQCTTVESTANLSRTAD